MAELACLTGRAGGAKEVLPALEYLAHPVATLPLDEASMAAAAAKELTLADADVTRISLADYPMPLYDGNLEAASGPPENAVKLKRMFGVHHGVFIASPAPLTSVPMLAEGSSERCTYTMPWFSASTSSGCSRSFCRSWWMDSWRLLLR